jgi:hypothetical protein
VLTACYGPLAPGYFACHHCDNPPCIRPIHLFAGTASDNVRDALHKGRLKNYRPPFALTADQAEAIRRRYRPYQVTQRALAAEFGVHTETIRRAITDPTYPKEHRYVH